VEVGEPELAHKAAWEVENHLLNEKDSGGEALMPASPRKARLQPEGEARDKPSAKGGKRRAYGFAAMRLMKARDGQRPARNVGGMRVGQPCSAEPNQTDAVTGPRASLDMRT
jgi:hypothetical protein